MIELLKNISIYLASADRPIELIKIVATAFTAYFTVKWSLKRFFKEKQWEQKHAAYSHVMEALHHLKRSIEKYMEDEFNEEGNRTNTKKLNEVHKRSAAAKSELEKYVDIGRYYISDTALDALQKIEKVHQECVEEFSHGGTDPYDLYKKEFDAVVECLQIVRSIAMKEVQGKKR